MNRASSSPDSKREGVYERKCFTIKEAIARLSETYADKVNLLVECKKIAAQLQKEGHTHVSLYQILNEATDSLIEEDIEEAFNIGYQKFTS